MSPVRQNVLQANRGYTCLLGRTHPVLRRLGMASAAIMFLIMMSCMSFSVGSRVYENKTEGGIHVQEGNVTVPAGHEQDVYYPIPYGSTPNLEVTDMDACVVVEQFPDHFRVKNTGHFNRCINWTARGVQCSPAVMPSQHLTPVKHETTKPNDGPVVFESR